MSLRERVYSVLIVSAAKNFNSALFDLLPESRYAPVTVVSDVSAAKRAFVERAYDYVIINSPLPDDIGTHFAIDACNARSTVVLLLVRSELYAQIYDKVAEYGVFTLPKPTSKPMLAIALDWMSGARERLRRTERKKRCPLKRRWRKSVLSTAQNGCLSVKSKWMSRRLTGT